MKKILIVLNVIFLLSGVSYAASIGTDAVLQYNQGIDYYKRGEFDKSITSFREAIALAPDYIDAYYNLGSVLEYLQQYDAALAVFKQIIVRKPEDYDALYKAAWLSAQLGDAQRAKTYLGIIPQGCERGEDAQILLNKLNIDYPSTQQKQVQNDSVKTISLSQQESGLYENISAPTGITSDKDGNIYIAEFSNNAIVKFTPDGKKVLFLKDAKISGPIGLACDDNKNMYIANYNKDNVLKVSNLGEISVLISNVKKPYYLYIDGDLLFISCQGSDSVLRYKLH